MLEKEIIGKDGKKMALIPAGEFIMGHAIRKADEIARKFGAGFIG